MAGITTEYRVNAQCVEVKNGELHIEKYEEKTVHYASVLTPPMTGYTSIHITEGPAYKLVEFLTRHDPQIPITMRIDGDLIKMICRQYTLKNHAFVSAEFIRVVEV